MFSTAATAELDKPVQNVFAAIQIISYCLSHDDSNNNSSCHSTANSAMPGMRTRGIKIPATQVNTCADEDTNACLRRKYICKNEHLCGVVESS